MENEKDLLKALDSYKRELRKDHIDNEIQKKKFIMELKNGLGDKMTKTDTYIKKEPTMIKKIKTKLLKFFSYI